MAAKIADVSTLIAAGINPRNGLPTKLGDIEGGYLKENMKKLLRVVDEQDAVNRYTWFNLPDGIDNVIERIIYYKGQGMFFYIPTNTTFYFLPFTLDGEIDVYGQFTGVTPLPFNGVSQDKDGKDKPWITGLVRKPQYSIQLDQVTMEDIETKCVILRDYTQQLSQTVIPRQQLNDPLLDVMSECVPFMQTALINATGVRGVRVNDPDQAASVTEAGKSIHKAALKGEVYVPAVGTLEFQDLSEGPVAKTEEFMLAMQSLDNFRLGLYGIDNGGLFEKKAHELQAEAAINGGPVGLVYEDGLKLRQHFCDIVNSIWGLGIWCDANENIAGDRNMNGMIDSNNQSDGGSVDGNKNDSTVQHDTV